MVTRITITLFCTCILGLNAFSQDTTQTTKVAADSLNLYQVEKLKQEIEKLKSENTIKPIYRILPTYAGILTALIAILGALISYRKYLIEKRMETKVRLEDNFNTIIENIGSESPSIQASAIVSLLTFLNEEYKEFHLQVYTILLANLKIGHAKNVNALMVKAFERALPIYLKDIKSQRSDTTNDSGNQLELDLSRTNLYRIDLHGENLENVDLAYSNLQNANLSGCNLKRAKGIGADLSGARLSRANLNEGRFNKANFENAHFHETNLVSATLKNSNLKGAEFQRASLQEAHLEGSEIDRAKFEEANLNNTFFKNVNCNEAVIKSILRSKGGSWKKANFDPEIKEKLQEFSTKM